MNKLNTLNKSLRLIIENSQTDEEFVLSKLKELIKNSEWENRLFLVGGAVRDELLGGKAKDLDFVVNGDLNAGIDFATWLTQELGNYKDGSNPVIFPRFGTAKVSLTNNNLNLPDIELEFVAPRKEEYTDGSRKPDVTGGDMYDEVMRRDLTINSLMKNVSTDEIIDLSGKGLKDLENGIIRTTSDPDLIFTEDPLRMMRCIRFYGRFDFKLDDSVLPAIKRNAHLINNISSERINDELNKMLMVNKPSLTIKLLRDSGLLRYVMSELQDAVGMTQNAHHKDDVFDHTMAVLDNTPPNLNTRLMALFHDIGKTLTRSVTPEGSVHFYDHENVGVDIVRKVMNRLKYSNVLVNAVVTGVQNHMRLKHGGDDGDVSDKTLRKFASKVGENLDDILDLIHADNISHADASSMPNQINNIRKRLEHINQNLESSKPKLPINGNDLIQMGIKPSPMFKSILTAVEDAWFDNPNISRDEALEIVRGMVKESKLKEFKTILNKINIIR